MLQVAYRSIIYRKSILTSSFYTAMAPKKKNKAVVQEEIDTVDLRRQAESQDKILKKAAMDSKKRKKVPKPLPNDLQELVYDQRDSSSKSSHQTFEYSQVRTQEDLNKFVRGKNSSSKESRRESAKTSIIIPEASSRDCSSIGEIRPPIVRESPKVAKIQSEKRDIAELNRKSCKFIA